MGTSVRGHHADRVLSAIAANEAARSALVASWERSSCLHGLTPAERRGPRRLLHAEYAPLRQAMEPLIGLAAASLDRLYAALGGTGCCVLLADRNGVPVERRGAPGDDPTFRDWGLWPGTLWAEDSEGTNGIGTCLVEKRVLTIDRTQHFFSRNTGLTCTTAPIFDHDAQLVAALDVSSCRADLTEGLVSLISVAVSDAARRIEAEAFQAAFPRARIMLVPGTDANTAALVAVDAEDLVIGATRAARQALRISGEDLKHPLPAADLLGDIARPAEALDEAERAVVQRALARAQGNVTLAARALGISRATLHRKLARYGIRRGH